MDEKMITRSIIITEKQDHWADINDINLSKLVRRLLDEHMAAFSNAIKKR